jgi:hypothetical protein
MQEGLIDSTTCFYLLQIPVFEELIKIKKNDIKNDKKRLAEFSATKETLLREIETNSKQKKTIITIQKEEALKNQLAKIEKRTKAYSLFFKKDTKKLELYTLELNQCTVKAYSKSKSA